MFKHILLPTDGSELSEGSIRKGIQFAKSIGARVTGFYAMPEFHIITYRTEMLEDTKEEFAKDSKAHADKYLAVIERAAKRRAWRAIPCERPATTHTRLSSRQLRTRDAI